MYCAGLGFRILGRFEDHQGFDGVMLGNVGLNYHFEFTYNREHSVEPTPTSEDLIVLYISDYSEWKSACANMLGAGFKQVTSFNPYWDTGGQTFEDRDGYRIVLQNAEWVNVEGTQPRTSVHGILSHLGPAPSAEEIDEVRREMWANFPREDI